MRDRMGSQYSWYLLRGGRFEAVHSLRQPPLLSCPQSRACSYFMPHFLPFTPLRPSDRGLQRYQHTPFEDTPSALIASHFMRGFGLQQRKNYLID